jgi:hypothetical protein
VNATATENLDRDIPADQQTPPDTANDDDHQQLGWSHLKATLAQAKPQRAPGQELVPFPRTRLTSDADLAKGLRGTVNTLAHRLSKAQTRAFRQRMEDLALR